MKMKNERKMKNEESKEKRRKKSGSVMKETGEKKWKCGENNQ